MARSQAANLSGLLSDIGGTLGRMGEPGQQYVDTFRRSMAPEVDASNSDSLMNYANYARRNGYGDEAKQYMAMGYQQKTKEAEEAKRLSEEAAARQGEYSISTLQNRMTNILKGNPPDAEAQLSALQDQINSIARGVPGLSPSNYSDSRQKASADYRQEREQASVQDARAQRLENDMTRLGFSKDTHYWTGQRFEEWKASQPGVEQLRNLQIEAGKLQAAANAANLFVTRPNGKEEYVAKFPEYGSLFDVRKQEHDLRQAQLEEIQSRAKWDYTDKDIKTILAGFPEEMRNEQATAVMRHGSTSAAAGKAALAQAYQASLQYKDSNQGLNGLPPKFLMDTWRPLVTSIIDSELAGNSPLNLLKGDDADYYDSVGSWASNISEDRRGVLINEALLKMANVYSNATSNTDGMNMAVLSLMGEVTEAQQSGGGLTSEQTLEQREQAAGIVPQQTLAPQPSGVLSR